MKKMITFALLAMMVAGQAQANRGGKDADTNVTKDAQSKAAVEDAKKTVTRTELQAQVSAVSKLVKESSAANNLSETQKRNLMKNMIRDADVKKVAETILADKDPSRAELNAVTLEGLANIQAKTTSEQTAQALGATDAVVAKDAMKSLFVDILGSQARGWKDATQVKNALSLGKEVNSQMRQTGKTDFDAMKAAIAKFEADTGIKIDMKKLNELCNPRKA